MVCRLGGYNNAPAQRLCKACWQEKLRNCREFSHPVLIHVKHTDHLSHEQNAALFTQLCPGRPWRCRDSAVIFKVIKHLIRTFSVCKEPEKALHVSRADSRPRQASVPGWKKENVGNKICILLQSRIHFPPSHVPRDRGGAGVELGARIMSATALFATGSWGQYYTQ